MQNTRTTVVMTKPTMPPRPAAPESAATSSLVEAEHFPAVAHPNAQRHRRRKAGERQRNRTVGRAGGGVHDRMRYDVARDGGP